MCDTNKCATGYTGRAILPAGTFAPNHYVQFHYILNHAISKPLLYPLFSRLPIHLRVLLFIHVFFLRFVCVCLQKVKKCHHVHNFANALAYIYVWVRSTKDMFEPLCSTAKTTLKNFLSLTCAFHNRLFHIYHGA